MHVDSAYGKDGVDGLVSDWTCEHLENWWNPTTLCSATLMIIFTWKIIGWPSKSERLINLSGSNYSSNEHYNEHLGNTNQQKRTRKGIPKKAGIVFKLGDSVKPPKLWSYFCACELWFVTKGERKDCEIIIRTTPINNKWQIIIIL